MKDDKKQTDDLKANKGSVSSITKLTLGILASSVIIFYLYVMSDRHTPYTDLARVREINIPIAPRVSGYLHKINVQLHSVVKEEDVIFEIDPRPYELALAKEEANLDNTIQQLGAQSSSVKAAASAVGVAKAQLDRSQRNYDRVMRIYNKNPGALSMSDRDRVETSLNQSIENLANAEANLEAAKKQMGELDENNPKVRLAIAKVKEARLNLEFTKVYAGINGHIESFNVDLGFYCNAGQALATCVSDDNKWIQADLKENNLSHLSMGDSAYILLDVFPGRTFKAEVSSIGYGVSTGSSNKGELPTINTSSSWMREPQRFPVIFKFSDNDALSYCRNGGQADVVVFTGDKKWLNKLGVFRIWLNSKLSFIR